ncbi:MAG: alpha/beta hydrolase [Bacillota bacterium]
MRHRYERGKTDRTLVLFHGTGGSMDDLVGIAKVLDSSAHVIALEGDVDEHGMKRFFKRIRPGVFDEQDLIERTHALDDTLKALAKKYEVPVLKMVLVGYSNGANIISSYLSLFGKKVAGALLFQPMLPFRDTVFEDLEGLPVFMSASENDPIVPLSQSTALIDAYKKAHAKIQPYWHKDGHSLSNVTIEKAVHFFQTHWA